MSFLCVLDNNLVGSLSDIGRDSPLTDLTLSHNQLIGTIPTSIQSHGFVQLDLSNNRLRGTLIDDFSLSYAQSSLQLAVNRLSGPLPSSFFGLSASSMNRPRNLTTMNVLSGNIFSCNNADIPSLDEFSISYSCGSYDLDVSSYSWLVTAAICALVAIVIRLSISVQQNKILIELYASSRSWWMASFDLMRSYECKVLIHHRQDNSVRTSVDVSNIVLPETSSFLIILRLMVRWCTVLLFIMVLVILPGYLGLHQSSATVSYDYGFVVSVAYLHGIAPVIFIGGIISLLLIGLSVFIPRISSKLFLPLSLNKSDQSTILKSNYWYVQRFSLILCLHLLNIIVTISVNAAYVSASLSSSSLTRSSLLLLQGCIGLFKLSWNAFYIPWSCNRLVNYLDNEQAMLNRMSMSITNFIIAPVIATIVVNQSCFYYVFNAIPAVTSSVTMNVCYTYLSCGDDDYSSYLQIDYCCTSYQDVVFTSTTYPSFTYSYACGTALLTSYTPVLIYSYLAYGIVVPVIRLIACYWNNSIENISVVILLFKLLGQGLKFGVKGRDAVVTMCLHLSVLLTFGVASPVLGVVILIAIIIDCCVSYLLIGRYIVSHKVGTSEIMKGGITRLEDGALSSQSAQNVNTYSSSFSDTRVSIIHNESKDINMDHSVLLEDYDMKDSYRGFAACYVPLVIVVSAFWALLFFDMIADYYSILDGMATSLSYGLGVSCLSFACYVSTFRNSEVFSSRAVQTTYLNDQQPQVSPIHIVETMGLSSLDINHDDS
jgi:hypothetical protein